MLVVRIILYIAPCLTKGKARGQDEITRSSPSAS